MLKLTDFLNPQHQQDGLARMRCLKNSIKRNIIFPSVTIKKTQANSQYETKINSLHFQNKDLFLLFQHLYSKDEMLASDRNLIRRILLTLFPEKLIAAGGKKLVYHTKFWSLQKGQKFQGDNMFYLLMKGDIKIQSPFYQRSVTGGMFFGHLQLLTSCPQDSFIAKVQSDASLICITYQGFHENQAHYFQKIYETKQKVIPKIIIDKLQPVELLLMLQEMNRKQYAIGQKIGKKNDVIQQIFFLQEGKLCENIQMEPYIRKYRAQNTVGLIQAFIGSKVYKFDMFAMQQTKGYSISYTNFVKLVQKDLLNTSKITSSYLNQSLNQRSKTEISSPSSCTKKVQQQIQSLRKFMRIRKVNLPLTKTKSPHSQTNISTQFSHSKSKSRFSFKYEADFIFIKDTQTPQRNKNTRVNRSFSLIREQPQAGQIRKYLDNVHVPAFQRYQDSESRVL